MVMRLLQTVLNRLLPPTCREHVLGDLEERSRLSTGSNAAREHLIDALRMIPLIVWSQMRRAVPPRLFAAQALVAYTAFGTAAFQALGFAFFNDEYGFIRIAAPTLVSLLVLALADTYSTPMERPPWHQSKLVGLALSGAFLVNFVISVLRRIGQCLARYSCSAPSCSSHFFPHCGSSLRADHNSNSWIP